MGGVAIVSGTFGMFGPTGVADERQRAALATTITASDGLANDVEGEVNYGVGETRAGGWVEARSRSCQ
jgi:hypothetical protein